jgi:exopolysaccharide biosynthesis polyprenyl glycosylphosphotransferase
MAAPDFAAQNIYIDTAASADTTAQARFDRNVQFAQAALDALTTFVALLAAYFLCLTLSVETIARVSFIDVAALAACFAMLVSFLHVCEGAYRRACGLLQIRETEREIRISVQSTFLLWAMNLLLRLNCPSGVFLLCCLLVPLLLLLQRCVFFRGVAQLRRSLSRDVRVVVYGAGETGRLVLSGLLDSPRLGWEPVAVIDDACTHRDSLHAMGYRGRISVPLIKGILTPDVLRDYRANLLLIASGSLSPQRIAAAKDAARLAGASVGVLYRPAIEEQQFTRSFDVDGLKFAAEAELGERRIYGIAKRAMDLILSSVLLVILSPLFLAIAILIRLDSSGPALFVQQRIGKNGALFRMLKFRTMYSSTAKYQRSPTSPRDWRITCIGRALRRTSLDELPQLINVFLGDMSLVGPRPEMPFVVDTYTDIERQRLIAIPGITGLWQLSADRAYPIHHNIQYDFYYIRNRTLAMDIAIMVHTLIFAMCGGI